MLAPRRALTSLLVLAALLAFTGGAFAQEPVPTTTEPAPAPAPLPVAPPSSFVAGVDISGLDQAAAVAKVNAAFAERIVIRVEGRVFKVTSEQLGATYATDAAVTEAMARPNGGNTPITVKYRASLVTEVAERIQRMADDKGREAQWIIKPKPAITRPKPGMTVSKARIEKQIVRALAQPLVRPEQATLPLVEVDTDATLAKLGYVVTVSKGERVLRLWAPIKGKARVVKQYRIAVGAPSFPTPSGTFTIVRMQKNPWWYPPASDWAKDEEPVPPGPGNPLGTRWMGLDRDDIGIHGTPDSGSIGGYASHGCIRMLIHQAEALFEKVGVGTPVRIY
ncbi:MAG: L,D-transpeptidase [Actinobacteria bacterium]|nr:L,D-transpeptidase [Actinomycetota bacterium]